LAHRSALTDDDRNTFARDGVLVRRAHADPRLVDRAARLVDAWYRDTITPDLDPDRLAAYTNRTFAPELADHRDLLALYTDTGLADLATELLHPAAPLPVTTAQVQIRIPRQTPAGPLPKQLAKAMHVDGIACPHLDPAELRTFTLLVGVPLTPVTAADGGALHYVLGGHLRMAHWFAHERTPGEPAQTPPDIATRTGTPLLGAPGDVVLMHHLVPHRVDTNHTADPRPMAYFRVTHPDHHAHVADALRDPWLEYPTLRSHAARHDTPDERSDACKSWPPTTSTPPPTTSSPAV
jgi:hypothetical protein